MKGILIRVGIDSTAGEWNAPVNPSSGSFVYVPIPEQMTLTRNEPIRRYNELISSLEHCSSRLPFHLMDLPMHLDPDFEHLTYGDCYPRNLQIKDIQTGDFITFYAGLRSINPRDKELIYALIGFFIIDEVIPAEKIPRNRLHENAHTRRESNCGDLIVRARKGQSGRLEKCIRIGEYRDRAYRVYPDLLDKWGGLSVKDGYLQRSGRIPSFTKPEQFLTWFWDQKIPLETKNF